VRSPWGAEPLSPDGFGGRNVQLRRVSPALVAEATAWLPRVSAEAFGWQTADRTDRRVPRMTSLLASLLRRLDAGSTESSPDAALLHRLATTRDKEAFAALVGRHGPAVYRVCRRLLSPDDAEDAFQATFLVLAKRAGAVQQGGAVGGWLVGVAGRVARELRRARRRRAGREVPLDREVAAAPDPDGLESAEHLRALDEELARLPGHLRGPVVTCLLQGRTSEEVAAGLGSSARTVRRRVEQAKRVLRARLERRGVAPAVAAALVAEAGVGAAAVPVELVRRSVGVLNDYLAGGTSPPAVLAEGVAKAMTLRNVLTPVAAAAVCLTVLGVGLAGGDPRPRPVQPVAPPPASLKSTSPPTDGAPARPGPGAVRAIEHEAKLLLSVLTIEYAGEHKTSRWKVSVVGTAVGDPVPPPRADEIRVLYRPGPSPTSNTELTFEGGTLTRAWVNVSGPLDAVLDGLLNREMHRVVLAEQLGRPLPGWVNAASSPFGDLRRARAADERCRAGLAAGKCLRLPALFALRDPPADAELAAAQSHAVLRFLLNGTTARDAAMANRRFQAFLGFVAKGSSGGWDDAAQMYGFTDVGAMEAAWLRWMDTEESVVRITTTPPRPLAQRVAPVAMPTPATIPPTRVRDQ
jgi:RNA polymerase sigma factor (sigma-70 family)